MVLGLLSRAWRDGSRAWPATLLVGFSTLALTPLMLFAAVWFIFYIPFSTFANGTAIVAPTLIPAFMTWTILLTHVVPFSFMGTPWSISLGLLTTLASLVLVPFQFFFLWPGLTDGRAGVPYHTPLINISIDDPFWPYMIFCIGEIPAMLGLLGALIAFSALAIFYIVIAVSHKIPGPWWILSGLKKATRLLPH